LGQKRSNTLLLVMAITAAIVTPLVIFGVYLGYYVGGVIGYSKPVLGIVFSTIGFIVAIAIVTRAIVWIVARSAGTKP
jgi:membrane protein DedA with SNARE-associated domain